jgi:hypothetical protein
MPAIIDCPNGEFLLFAITALTTTAVCLISAQWRNYYGLRPGEPGGPQPQWAKWGPPGLGDRAKTLARASDMLQCRFLTMHQNSVKSLPKVQEMAFQRV